LYLYVLGNEFFYSTDCEYFPMSGSAKIDATSWVILDNFSARTQSALAQELIEIFSDEGDVIFDPLLGNAQVLFASHSLSRNAVSFSADVAQVTRITHEIKLLESQLKLSSYGARQFSKQLVFESSLEKIEYMWQQYSLPQIDLIVSFIPSYPALLKTVSSFYPGHSVSPLAVIENILLSLYAQIREGAYIVFLVENHKVHSEYTTFAWEFVAQLKKHFVFKYEKIVCVGKTSEVSFKESDISHKYLLVFQKE
jgi:hypothetical protein